VATGPMGQGSSKGGNKYYKLREII